MAFIMNLPNKLTILRIVLIPVFVACFYLPVSYSKELAAVVFAIAFTTDILDGQLARKQNIVTKFGKLMDPIADKLLTFSAFIMLGHIGQVSPIVTIVVMARELLVSGFRMVAVEGKTVIAASMLGKIKTVSQCVAIMFSLLWHLIDWDFPLDSVLVWISVAITIWSGIDYYVKNAENIDFN
ncbi:CDP-diacylglycerol--glycerol-3-phosphate 3-phosphatidyltransferase [Christensenellaceae bacterium OttesenSCG-928-M15]|nr:CDP-diacylglycerol--glycerol-3-phosphate 3-phosphatidyltransferase [Christensenellaceae bacterium OttesenSCG-928-M15]